MTTTSWYHGRLQELSEADCMELLTTKKVGRLAYVGPEGPEIIPINFVAQQGSVLFRTSPHSVLGRCSPIDVAAFEVDEVDDFTESGWSVLLRGTAELVEDVLDLPREARPVSWAEGARPLFVRVPGRSITGRRLYPA
jgi:nitroimidazol reductase NimA-like FMN-containing flavoprotein (pyridoxamine 5'-phosphate oxidase superfamily)